MTDDNISLYGDELPTHYSKALPGTVTTTFPCTFTDSSGHTIHGTFQAFEDSPFGEFTSLTGIKITCHKDELGGLTSK